MSLRGEGQRVGDREGDGPLLVGTLHCMTTDVAPDLLVGETERDLGGSSLRSTLRRIPALTGEGRRWRSSSFTLGLAEYMSTRESLSSLLGSHVDSEMSCGISDLASRLSQGESGSGPTG